MQALLPHEAVPALDSPRRQGTALPSWLLNLSAVCVVHADESLQSTSVASSVLGRKWLIREGPEPGLLINGAAQEA